MGAVSSLFIKKSNFYCMPLKIGIYHQFSAAFSEGDPKEVIIC